MQKRGFTLIELLIVVAIIAILAAIAVPNFLEAQVRAKVARTHADMRSIATAIESYTVDWNVPPRLNYNNGDEARNFSWPLYFYTETGQGNVEPGSHGAVSLTTPVSYMTSFPEDPFIRGEEFATSLVPWPRLMSYFFVNNLGAYKAAATRGYVPYVGGQGIAYEQMLAALPVVWNRPITAGGNQTGLATWFLTSPGPDRTYDDPAESDEWGNPSGFSPVYTFRGPGAYYAWSNGVVNLYDATNGTTSVGQIVRSSAGIGGE